MVDRFWSRKINTALNLDVDIVMISRWKTRLKFLDIRLNSPGGKKVNRRSTYSAASWSSRLAEKMSVERLLRESKGRSAKVTAVIAPFGPQDR